MESTMSPYPDGPAAAPTLIGAWNYGGFGTLPQISSSRRGNQVWNCAGLPPGCPSDFCRVRPIVIFLLLGRYLITGISKISNIRPNIRPIGPTLAIKLSSISSDAVITYCNFQWGGHTQNSNVWRECELWHLSCAVIFSIPAKNLNIVCDPLIENYNTWLQHLMKLS